MSTIVNQWQFSVTLEGLKLTNTSNTYTVYFTRRDVAFITESNDIFIVNNLTTNNQIKINRHECTIPAPGASMSDFLDSLATLASV